MTSPPEYCELPISWLTPDQHLKRTALQEDPLLADLAQSIREHGVLQPILVRKLGDGYRIVAGERRWRAAWLAGLQTVPVMASDYDDAQALQTALIENLLRIDLDPLEEASAYRQLVVEHHLTHDELAKAMGKSRALISNRIRLLRLPTEILQFMVEGRLTAGHIRPLIGLKDPELALRLARQFVDEQVSTSEVSKRVARVKK